MGIKDLFDKGHSLKFVKNKTKDDLKENLESSRYVDSYTERRERAIPDVNFATASNFARFGLAEEYYDTAIKRIYQTYPYDGSQAEKIEWENESTYLDLFIFENEYPRTTGYVVMGLSSSFDGAADNVYPVYESTSPEYIFIKGGPHADPAGDYKSEFSAGSSKTGVSKANIYHVDTQRTNNLELDLSKGTTVEFWLKKDGWASEAAEQHEYLFHSWNSGSHGAEPTHPNGSLRAYIYGETAASKGIMNVKAVSGSTEITFQHDTNISNIADGLWHHYAFTLRTEGNATVSNLYVDGKHTSLSSSATTINEVTGTMVACIGGLAGPLTGSTTIGRGWGNVASASFDEFRYWKTARNAQQVGRFYLDQIGGGTNTDNIKYDDITNKVDLGVYYKFNEGITGDSSTDATILDYSGRISNGTFINYGSTSRNTGSAIVSSSAATREFRDPIIYSNHSDVAGLLNSKKSSGSMHDHNNPSSIYKSLPGWIAEEDEQDSNHLKYLTQILASYFDDLYLQIQKFSKLKDINYPDDSNYEKPLPFADRLLNSRGYDAPELFADAHDLAKYMQRGEKKLFEKKLYEVKNTIYQNIYNNLSYIQKSKGTFKSLRNFLRCFGVDEELVKLNIYSNNGTYEFKDNVTHTAVRKKYIDFDDLETRYSSSANYSDSFSATAYQYYDSNDENSISYIPIASGSVTGAMMTIETELIFPKRSIVGDKNHVMFPSTTSSIFGLHAVTSSNTDLTFDSSDTINFNIVATRPDNDLRNVKFALITSGTSVFSSITNSSSFQGVYDNEKWNLAFRLKPSKTKEDTSPMLYGSTGFLQPAESAYSYELYGVNYVSNTLQSEFTLSGTISLAEATTFFTNPKRVFIGAARTNFTGSVEVYSDVKISSTRVWLDYLPNEVIRAHARDPSSYGALQPYRNSNDGLNTNYVPQISTLIMNWDMENVTGSDSGGQFLIEDFASGSLSEKLKFGNNWAKSLNRYNYAGRGDKFTADANFVGDVVDIEFVPSAKQKLPEVVNSDDMVKILNKQDDVVFTRDTTYIQNLLSVEKSMYQTISEEMLRLFATITDFNNLIGEPVNRYRPNYKKLEKLRQLFFESVENDRLDLEKFIEYFKWIDDAVTIMIAQLIPVSSNAVDILRNMVESHVLERNKYWSKFPTLEIKSPDVMSSLRGIEELKYNWKFGHAPLSPNENTNQDQSCLWWKQRAERDIILSSGDATIDSEKNKLLKIAVTEVTGSEPILKNSDGTRYSKSYYGVRSLARAIDLESLRSLKLKGGGNPVDNVRHDYYKGVVKWGSDDDFIYLDIDNEISPAVCNDKEIPDEINKKKFRMKALTMPAGETINSGGELTLSGTIGVGEKDSKYSDAKSSLLLPFSIYSSSIDTGYQKLYSDQFKIDFTNLHEDKYGPHAEIPMQGPFTERHVGGAQHRHVQINHSLDSQTTRPEGWHLQEYLNEKDTTITETVINELFTGATTTATTDVTILAMPAGSAAGDPSPYEYWRNGVCDDDNSWTFLKGATPSAGTGPGGSSLTFAYCEVLPSKVGQTFGLVTPLIDLTEVKSETPVAISFSYHMFGLNIGNLKVQISSDPDFQEGVDDLLARWNIFSIGASPGNFESNVIAGQRQSTTGESFHNAIIGHNFEGSGLFPATTNTALSNYIGKRCYIRFLYTAGPGHLGDCAIDLVNISIGWHPPGIQRNSFKLLSPTHDNHNRPSAMYTRDTMAKRPVNIKNIEMTGSSPTIAGNYLNRYEYVNTLSPETNDPYFVKNHSQISQTTMRYPTTSSIEAILASGVGQTNPAAAVGDIRGSDLVYSDHTLPDRSTLDGTVRNKTRIKTRFSAPGGFETLSRGFLDPAHETYSVYNVMTFRNLHVRKVHNSQLQAHQGRFGVSAHSTDTARVYGSETAGAISENSYRITGDASAHKYHRNNMERIEHSDSDSDFRQGNVVTASVFDNAFVSHMIPRTDQQMRWITASIDDTQDR
jgi:hypothetical protein